MPLHWEDSAKLNEPRSEEEPRALDANGEEKQSWDGPQSFQGRRDAEPHRGTLILVLGVSSIVVSTIGGCFMGLGGLIGLPLGIIAWVLGRRDLIKMHEHMMDQDGRELTKAGWICGVIGTVLGSICSVGFLIYVGFVFTMITSMRRAPMPPMAPPVPAPVRPAPAPAPGPPGNRAGVFDVHSPLADLGPAANA
ncbi:MAG TPA: hypothetical protein VKU02_09465 [Gemmataceae bacterium]|nr:hypothetical protein [Gemmataceae bacterium]